MPLRALAPVLRRWASSAIATTAFGAGTRFLGGADQVMGGVSFGKHDFLNENNKKFIRMTGYVSLENNGGFIQVRRILSKEDKKIENGIQLELRGNNQIYFIHYLFNSPVN